MEDRRFSSSSWEPVSGMLNNGETATSLLSSKPVWVGTRIHILVQVGDVHGVASHLCCFQGKLVQDTEMDYMFVPLNKIILMFITM